MKIFAINNKRIVIGPRIFTLRFLIYESKVSKKRNLKWWLYQWKNILKIDCIL
jgi:hypothetical protein